MTCSKRFKENCPTGGSKVTAEEGDCAPRCIHAGCEAPLKKDDTCTKGHSQCHGESAREMLAEVEQLFAQQAAITDPTAMAQLLTRAHKLAERSRQYATGIEDTALAAQATALLQAAQTTRAQQQAAGTAQTWWQKAGLVNDGTGRLVHGRQARSATKVTSSEVDGKVDARPRCGRCGRILVRGGPCPTCRDIAARTDRVEDALRQHSPAEGIRDIAAEIAGPQLRARMEAKLAELPTRLARASDAPPSGEDAAVIPRTTPGWVPGTRENTVAAAARPFRRAPGVATDAPPVFSPTRESLGEIARTRGLPSARGGWCVCGQPRRSSGEPCTNPRCAKGMLADPEERGTTCVHCGNPFWPAEDGTTQCPFCRTLYTRSAGENELPHY